MNKRAMTVAEIQAMLENLADKVQDDAVDLFNDVKSKIEDLKDVTDDKIEYLMDDLIPKLEDLKNKVTDDGKEVIDKIEERIDSFKEDIGYIINEETAELKRKGFWRWAGDNPHIIGGLLIILSIIVLAIVL